MPEVKEECGVIAVSIKKNIGVTASYLAYRMLLELQNRGQESAGIVTFNADDKIKLKRYVDIGEVIDVFKVKNEDEHKKILDYYSGSKAIGHVRYATSGSKEYGNLIAEAQPFLRRHGKIWKKFAIAFNGNLANYKELAKELQEDLEYELETDVDTEVMMHFFSVKMKKLEEIVGKEPELRDVIAEVCEKFDGAYNVVFLNSRGDLAVFRDPLGIRPLWYGENEDFFAAASESTALKSIGLKEKNLKEVPPGHVIILK